MWRFFVNELLEQLAINPQLILVNIIGFLILLWLLKKFLYRPIGQMLESRKAEIQDTYAAAEAQRASMEEMRKDYERKVAGIEAEATAKIQAAVKEAQGIRDEIVNEARAKAESILDRGAEEIQREKQKAIVELREEVANLAIGASSKLLERDMDDNAHRKLIDDFISSAGKAQ